MEAKQTRYHPRLSDDVGEVIAKLAKKNGRSLPQELDFILRPILFNRPQFLVGEMSNGESADPKNAVGASLAEEANGLRLEWNAKKKQYDQKKVATSKKR